MINLILWYLSGVTILYATALMVSWFDQKSLEIDTQTLLTLAFIASFGPFTLVLFFLGAFVMFQQHAKETGLWNRTLLTIRFPKKDKQ